MRGQPIKDSLSFFLFLRGKKRVGARSGGGRSRGGKEEERGGRRTPIQGSTRPVGMECRYKSPTSLPLPRPLPFVPHSPLSSRLHQTLLLLLRLSSASTAGRRPRCCSPNHQRVLPLSTGFTIYHYTTVRACSTTTTRRYRSALLLLLPPLLSTAAATADAAAAITTCTRSRYYLRTFSSFYY